MAAPDIGAEAAYKSPAGRPLAPEGGEVTASGAGTQLSLQAFVQSKRALTGTAIIVLLGLFCFVGPLLYHTNQVTVNLGIENSPPGPGYPLGTDQYGIDVLGRLMTGGQSSLELGFAVGIATTVIGLLYGSISGMAGGIVDAFMMRIIDTVLAVPTFILLLIVASMFSLSLSVIILILTALSWPYTARLIRGQVLALRSRDFVQASRTMGATGRWILARHMVPNTLGVSVVTAAFAIADSIYALSALSFLGIGPPPPFTDWGTMLSGGVNNLFNGYWWQVYPPLVVLVLVVVAFRQVGDALNDIVSGQRSNVMRRRRRFRLLPLSAPRSE
ncbi:MAG: ABC transporter permease [Streptosporangiaceae bacterium]|jgi:peptide/nickel transport system permease protein